LTTTTVPLVVVALMLVAGVGLRYPPSGQGE
jgi:hypothetical protein